jgi:hypothetical protein
MGHRHLRKMGLPFAPFRPSPVFIPPNRINSPQTQKRKARPSKSPISFSPLHLFWFLFWLDGNSTHFFDGARASDFSSCNRRKGNKNKLI